VIPMSSPQITTMFGLQSGTYSPTFGCSDNGDLIRLAQ